MAERIPMNMPIHTWVDRLILEAEERGEFDNLPGAGKPFAWLDKPRDENWWVNQKIRDEEVPSSVLLPPALQLRKEVAELPEAVRDLPDEESVRAAVADVNGRVAEWIRAPRGPVLPIRLASVEDIVAGWRANTSFAEPEGDSSGEARPGDQDDGSTSAVRESGRPRRRWWPW